MAIDILIFRQTNSGKYAEQSLIGDDGGQLCSGTIKLARRWLIEFSTESGTMPYRIRGCDFMRLARSGVFRTEMDVFQSFSLSEIDVRRNLLNEEDGTEPSNERYDGSRLEKVILGKGSLSIVVNVRSLAGIGVRLLMPVQFDL